MPILSLLARRILCIPATSAPSERLFSVAGLTIANDRAGLLPDNAADLIFLRGAWGLLLDNKFRCQMSKIEYADWYPSLISNYVYKISVFSYFHINDPESARIRESAILKTLHPRTRQIPRITPLFFEHDG